MMEAFVNTLLENGKMTLAAALELGRTLGEAALELGVQGFELLKSKTGALVRTGSEKLDRLSQDRRQAVLLAVAAGSALLAAGAGLAFLLRRRK